MKMCVFPYQDELLAELERLKKALDESLLEASRKEDKVHPSPVTSSASPSRPGKIYLSIFFIFIQSSLVIQLEFSHYCHFVFTKGAMEEDEVENEVEDGAQDGTEDEDEDDDEEDLEYLRRWASESL